MEEKCPSDIFQFYVLLRRTAHKGAPLPPLCEFPQPAAALRAAECPLDSSRSWDSALRPRTDSGLHAADRSEGTWFYPKRIKSYVSSGLTWGIPHFWGYTDILCRLAPDLNLQDSETLILAHRCMSEPAWASPSVRFVVGVIHKRAATGPLVRPPRRR